MFADLLDSGSGEKSLRLCDPVLESSQVLNRFLKLAAQAELSPKTSGTATKEVCDEVAPLIEFMRKYDCARLIPQMKVCLLEHLSAKRLHPMQVFAIGSALDSTLLCVTALEKACSAQHPILPGEEGEPLAHLRNGCPADPGGISLAVSRLIRPDHAWALNRAWALGITLVNCNGIMCPNRNLPMVVEGFKAALKSLESAPNA